MRNLRDTFILRCWRLPDGTERVAIEHVQSGEHASVGTVAAALDWLTGRAALVSAAPAGPEDAPVVATAPPDP